MPITHVQLRTLFKKFWEKQNHQYLPPISLIPQNDPTTLFTGSGMQQLISNLLGEPHPLGGKLYNIQPCFRSQDIEEVGDNRHTTFFEMMGNWSLGDYFKKEQLTWFWKFLTEVLGFEKDKLYVTVFAGDKKNNLPADTESIAIWKSLGVADDHIFSYGPEKNWWSRAGIPDNMPAGEPGGPDSEVFYQFDQIPHNLKYGKNCHPNCDCGRFLEIGNSVFMEYKKNPNGTFSELPNKNVDFGGGLERMIAALNNHPDIFTTDLYWPIINKLSNLTKKEYKKEKEKRIFRIIADHFKGTVFLIKNGVLPANKEQGYVVRRLIRRTTLKLRELFEQTLSPFFITSLVEEVAQIYQNTNLKLENKEIPYIAQIIIEETKKFGKTLEKGLAQIEKTPKITGKIAFDLYQSYGLPLEITEELIKQKGQTIDKNQFYQEFKKHQQLSRNQSLAKFKGGLADKSEQTLKYHTATHLLHQALCDVLGEQIRQEGSNITSQRLRFDFYSPKKPQADDIKKIETIINNKIQEKLPVSFKIMPKEKALKIGAKAFFREKYPHKVKIYFIGHSLDKAYSKEFCGGPHVKNTYEIGKIVIYKLEKIGNNLYRIYAK